MTVPTQTELEHPGAPTTSRLQVRLLTLLQSQGALIALIVVIVFSSVRYSNFLDQFTLYSTIDFNAKFGLIALGMTFVIMTGGIDLSVGGVAALGSVVVALMSPHGFWPTVLVVVLVGAVVGAVNGWIVAWLNIPPFLATLASLLIVRGVALVLAKDQSAVPIDMHSNFLDAATTTVPWLFDVPIGILIMIFAFIAGAVMLRYTSFGRYILAVGGNEEAARLMGLPVKSVKFGVYVISGALSAFAGLLLVGQLNNGAPIEGQGWELIAIAAVVVGGTLLSGGVGTVSGTFVGVILLGLIIKILDLENNFTQDHHGGGLTLNTYWQSVIRGVFLLAVVLLQSRLERQRAANRV